MKLEQGEQPHLIEKSQVERYLGLMVSCDLKRISLKIFIIIELFYY